MDADLRKMTACHQLQSAFMALFVRHPVFRTELPPKFAHLMAFYRGQLPHEIQALACHFSGICHWIRQLRPSDSNSEKSEFAWVDSAFNRLQFDGVPIPEFVRSPITYFAAVPEPESTQQELVELLHFLWIQIRLFRPLVRIFPERAKREWDELAVNFKDWDRRYFGEGEHIEADEKKAHVERYIERRQGNWKMILHEFGEIPIDRVVMALAGKKSCLGDAFPLYDVDPFQWTTETEGRFVDDRKQRWNSELKR
jgi:hypothetical protein